MTDEIDQRTEFSKERTFLANERNRLASERTFLAWTRTGLASVAGGLAIIRFLTFQNFNHQILSQVIGCVLVSLGITIFILSYMDYKNSYNSTKRNYGYTGSIFTVSIITFVLVTISIVMLLIAFKFAEVEFMSALPASF